LQGGYDYYRHDCLSATKVKEIKTT